MSIKIGITVSGGETYTVGPFENDIGDTVLHNGILDVLSGGKIVGTSVTGMVVVSAGGTAIETDLNSGGEQVVKGTAQSTTINSGGEEFVNAGGTTIGTTINAGGSQAVAAGGMTFNTTIDGGVEFVAGTANGTTINSGGKEIVSIDGKALATTINGGFMEVESGALTSGTTVSFTMAGGDLQLDASQSFEGLIAGFASPHGVIEEIDLVDIPFTNGKTTETFTEASNHLSGTLTVTSGSETANLTLLGQYSTANFHLASDLHGGTLVTDPSSPVAGNPVLTAHT